MKTPQDIIGNIAVLKFPKKTGWLKKKLTARKILKQNKNIKTVVEKTEKIKGRLRKPKTKHTAGKKTKQTIYKENNCIFKLNIDETYFSPRLSSHRKNICNQIAKKLKSNSKVLVMFAGIAPWAIVLAKILKTKYPKKKIKITSNEINKKANTYAKQNIRINKLEKYIKIISGDAKKLPEKLSKNYKADIIIMPRPNLKETFLKTALKLSKKGTEIYYHGFGKKQKVLDEIQTQLKKHKIKTSKIKIKKAGEIAPYEFRWLAVFKVK